MRDEAKLWRSTNPRGIKPRLVPHSRMTGRILLRPSSLNGRLPGLVGDQLDGARKPHTVDFRLPTVSFLLRGRGPQRGTDCSEGCFPHPNAD